MSFTGWLNGLKSNPQSKIRKRRRAVVNGSSSAVQELETRQLLSATGNDFSDAELQQYASEFAEQFDEFIAAADSIADAANEIPFVDSSSAIDNVSRMIADQLALQIPEEAIADYFQSRGMTVEHLADATETGDGITDLIRVDYDSTVAIGEWTVDASAFGEDNGIRLQADGDLSMQTTLDIDATFGMNHAGELFVVEGGEVNLMLTGDFADGQATGTLEISGLTNVNAYAEAGSDAGIVDASFQVEISDNDVNPNERFFLAEIQDVTDVNISGSIDVNASLSMDSPLQHLPQPIQTALHDVGMPSTMSWTADLHMDLATGEFDYTIDSQSLSAIDALFKSDSVEGALFNLMLDEFAQNNPIPESAQQFLGTELPLLDANVLDLIDVPRAAQYIIAPAAFRDASVSTTDAADVLDFDVEFFEAGNLARFLSGESYDIVSVSIDERFEKDAGTFTVMPETTLFSYLGIVNATLELQVSSGFFMDLDMTMGLDNDGFFIEGITESMQDDPHFAFGGELTFSGIAEADLLMLLDFARITVDAGLTGFGSVSLVSPDSETKMRAADITPENMQVGLGVDMNLGLKGELGLVDFDALDADVERDSTIEIYRSQAGTTLADAEQRLLEFKEQMEQEGKQGLFAAAAVIGNPILVATSAYVIYQDNPNIGRTAQTMIKEGIDLVDTVVALKNELGASLPTIAKTVYNDLDQGLGRTATVLRHELGAGLTETARILHDELDAGFTELFNVLRHDLKVGLGQTTGILRDLGLSPRQLAGFLNQLGIQAGDIASNLANQLGLGARDLADALYHSGAAKSLRTVASALDKAGISRRNIADALDDGLKVTPRQLADALYHGGVTRSFRSVAAYMDLEGRSIAQIADALDDQLKVGARNLADALYHGRVTRSFRTVAKYMDREGRSISQIADALDDKLKVSPRQLADAIYNGGVTRNLRSVAYWMRKEGRSISQIADALDDGLKVHHRDMAEALYHGVTRNLRTISKYLRKEGVSVRNIADALDDRLKVGYKAVADAIWNAGFRTNSRELAKVMKLEGASASQVASSMKKIGLSSGTIKDALSRGARFASSTINRAFRSAGIRLPRVSNPVSRWF